MNNCFIDLGAVDYGYIKQPSSPIWNLYTLLTNVHRVIIEIMFVLRDRII